jgi:hypothetical protein
MGDEEVGYHFYVPVLHNLVESLGLLSSNPSVSQRIL